MKKDMNILSKQKVGSSVKVLDILSTCLAKKKFADVGIVKGVHLSLEAKAPFGGLIRVKVLDTSISIHSNDAKYIAVELVK